jgi:hypothetical protein
MQVVKLSALLIGASLGLVSVNFLVAQTKPPPARISTYSCKPQSMWHSRMAS